MASDSTSLFLEAMRVSGYSSMEFLILVLTGAFACHIGYIDERCKSKLALLSMRLGFPCITFSMYASFSASKVQRWSVVLLIALLQQIIGGSLGFLFAAMMRLKPPHRQLLVFGCAFANQGAIPFVLVAPVVALWSRANEVPDPAGDAMAVIGLFIMVWCMTFFSIGKMYVSTAIEPRTAADGEATGTKLAEPSSQVEAVHTSETVLDDDGGDAKQPGIGEQRSPRASDHSAGQGPDARSRSPMQHATAAIRVLRQLIDPSARMLLVALFVGCIPELKALFLPTGPLRFIGSSVKSIGDSFIVVSTFVLGASLYTGLTSMVATRRKRRRQRVAAPSAEIERIPQRTGIANLSPSTKLTVATIAIKLFLSPACNMALLTLAVRRGWLTTLEPITLMICHIESAVPTAQTTIPLLLSIGRPRLAEQLSTSLLPQYFVSVVSVAIVIVAAVQIIGPAPSVAPPMPPQLPFTAAT